MADNVVVSAGVGTTVAADEVIDGTLGTVKVQFVKIMDGTLDGTTKAAVGANGMSCDVKAVPADPFGLNADAIVAAGATGSLSAKLRRVTQGLEDLKTLTVLAAGSNLIGLVTPAPATAGGPTVTRIKSAATTNATSVKASAGQVYGWYLYNNTASAKFFKVYNKASAPTVGTDTPAFTVPIPANGGTNIEFSMGVPLGTGIAYAITGAITDADTTATAADDVHGALLYK